MGIIDRAKRLISIESRVRELESSSEVLVTENTELRQRNALLNTRIDSLESALGRVLNMFAKQWSGKDEQAVMRSCRAILEDQSFRKK